MAGLILTVIFTVTFCCWSSWDWLGGACISLDGYLHACDDVINQLDIDDEDSGEHDLFFQGSDEESEDMYSTR